MVVRLNQLSHLTLMKSEVNSVCYLSRTLSRMRKLWQEHDSHQWVALQHGPLKLLLSCPVWGGGRETSWLFPSLLTSSLTSTAWNNGGKIISSRARRTGFKSWLCCVLFVWPSVSCWITLGSSSTKEIPSPNSQVHWGDWMWLCEWNATDFFFLTISIPYQKRIFLLNLEIFPFI